MADQLLARLDALGAQIAQGRFGSAEPWGGAKVCILAERPPASEPDPLGREPRFVVTPFAAELSWLFEQLRDAFGTRLDAGNKYDFYGRLAEAAEVHANASGDATSAGGLLAAVLAEARAMAGTGIREVRHATVECPKCGRVLRAVGEVSGLGDGGPVPVYSCPECVTRKDVAGKRTEMPLTFIVGPDGTACDPADAKGEIDLTRYD